MRLCLLGLDLDSQTEIFNKLNLKPLKILYVSSKYLNSNSTIQRQVAAYKIKNWYISYSLHSIDYKKTYKLLVNLVNNKYRNNLLSINEVTLLISRRWLTNIILSFIFTKVIVRSKEFSILNKFKTIYECFTHNSYSRYQWNGIDIDENGEFIRELEGLPIEKLKELVVFIAHHYTKRALYGICLEICWLGNLAQPIDI